MDSIRCWEDWRQERGNTEETERNDGFQKEEHTRLVIDEDSIYEIDLDCMKCKERRSRKE